MDFCLKDQSNEYQIPEECHCFGTTVWSLQSWQPLKNRLISAKSGLNDIPLNEWSVHTSLTDQSSLVVDLIKKRLRGRTPFLMTRAWLKLYEVLERFQLIHRLIRSGDTQLNVLALCECPGGFINAINHHIVSHQIGVRLEWMASTLNPYYEDIDCTIIDDQFIKSVKLFQNWFFGSTNTGNILDNNFVSDLKNEMNRRNIASFSLITCDGSVNCMDCPEAQEEVVRPLITKEILISLQVLAKGGSLVVKCFTLLECQTLSLVYLLCCSFKEIHVFKPNLSKSGNSEIYLVCIGFEPTVSSNTILTTFESKCHLESPLFTLQSIPKEFFDKVEEFVKSFVDKQISVIENNLLSFGSMSEQNLRQIQNRNKKFAQSLIKSLNIFSISTFDELVTQYEESATNCLKFKSLDKLLTNNQSFSQRKVNSNRFSDEWFESLSKVLIQINDNLSLKNQLIELKYWKQSSDDKQLEIKPIFGLTYDQISNSKFCDLSLITSYNKCMKCKEKLSQIGKSFVGFSSETKSLIKELIFDFESKKLDKNFVIYSKSCDTFVNQISKLLNIESVVDLLPDNSQTKNSHIFIVNSFSEFKLDLIEEKNVLIELVSQLNRIQSYISENDLLIVVIGFSLTRLMSATLYLISKQFLNYSFVPCIGGDEHNSHGMLGLFGHRIGERTQFGQQLNGLLDQLSRQKGRQSLVEIICVPHIISGNSLNKPIAESFGPKHCFGYEYKSCVVFSLHLRAQVLRDLIQRKLYSNVGIIENYVKFNNQMND